MALKKFFKDEQWTCESCAETRLVRYKYRNSDKFNIFLIKFDPQSTLKIIFQLFFKTLNELIGYDEISPQVISEFNNILSFLQVPIVFSTPFFEAASALINIPYFVSEPSIENRFFHIIPAEERREIDTSLFHYILSFDSFYLVKSITIKEITTLIIIALNRLSQGYNPNQKDENGLGLIDYTWMVKLEGDENNKYSNELFKIFLYYGAEIQSSLKRMIENSQHEKIKIFETAMYQLEKPVAKMKSSSLTLKKDHIATIFEFDNKVTIVSQLKNPTKLTKSELLQLFELAHKCFPSSNKKQKDNLVETLYEALAPNKDKLIELIYAKIINDLKLIGFAILIPLFIDNFIFSDVLLAGVDKDYRKLRLMTCYFNRRGHARQLTTDDAKVFNSADACTPAGFKTALSKHIPKLQPKGFSEIMKKRANLIHGNDAKSIHDGIICYTPVTNPISESKEHLSNNCDIRVDMFRRFQGFMDKEGFVLDLSKIDPNTIASREVPIAWPANLETVKEIQESLWEGFNYLNHCIQLSQLLPLLSNQKPKKTNLNYLDFTLFGCFAQVKKLRPVADSSLPLRAKL